MRQKGLPNLLYVCILIMILCVTGGCGRKSRLLKKYSKACEMVFGKAQVSRDKQGLLFTNKYGLSSGIMWSDPYPNPPADTEITNCNQNTIFYRILFIHPRDQKEKRIVIFIQNRTSDNISCTLDFEIPFFDDKERDDKILNEVRQDAERFFCKINELP